MHINKDLKHENTFNDIHNYDTRNKHNYNLTYKNKNYINSLPFKLKLLWNNMPQEVRNSKSLPIFKKQTLFYIQDGH